MFNNLKNKDNEIKLNKFICDKLDEISWLNLKGY